MSHHEQHQSEPTFTTDAGGRTGSLTRRELLVAGGVGAGALVFGGVLGACGVSAGKRADVTIRAVRSEVEFAGRRAKTWTYGGALPGRELRLKQGRPVRIRLVNELPEPTSIHWHGVRLRNAADGVPDMTQKPVAQGDAFDYVFTPPDPGTYFFHSHVGTQLDRGLYAALIVEPPRETLDYDREAVLLFDDWLDGLAGTPDQRLAELRANGMNMSGMNMGSGGETMDGMDMGSGGMRGTKMGSSKSARSSHTDLQGRAPGPNSLAWLANELEAGHLDAGDVPDYPLYLINGRPPADPTSVKVRRGDRVRLRLINPSSDTIFCVFVEGHELEVVRADGLAVRPVRTDAMVLGMGERYDVLLRAGGRGVPRIVGVPLGKRGRAVALLRYADARGPVSASDAPVRMPRRVLSYSDLVPGEDIGGGRGARDAVRVVRLDLAMGRGGYEWTIGGQAFPNADPVRVPRGENVQFVMRNRTLMPHPMHLHGHVFHVGGPDGPLKDTALALPNRELALDWVADNPGAWAYHCHNAYHQSAGMMRRVEVT